jgi:hypothetical protein
MFRGCTPSRDEAPPAARLSLFPKCMFTLLNCNDCFIRSFGLGHEHEPGDGRHNLCLLEACLTLPSCLAYIYIVTTSWRARCCLFILFDSETVWITNSTGVMPAEAELRPKVKQWSWRSATILFFTCAATSAGLAAVAFELQVRIRDHLSLIPVTACINKG